MTGGQKDPWIKMIKDYDFRDFDHILMCNKVCTKCVKSRNNCLTCGYYKYKTIMDFLIIDFDFRNFKHRIRGQH